VPYYPAFLDLLGKQVVVVGGGEIATGKVRGLVPCGPEPLVVIAPEVSGFIRGGGGVIGAWPAQREATPRSSVIT
jgi:siroheme synthase (precorrin-2 oxidase/ferrochelatase)